MNQEIKDKLEQVALSYAMGIHDHSNVQSTPSFIDFKRGAQAILDNPIEWGLETTKEALTGRNRILSLQLKNTELQSQLAKYREALERIRDSRDWEATAPELRDIAKEALKQEGTTCPKCGYPLFKHLGKTCCHGCDYTKQQ